jgi:outer membrane protein OmpA-like peptidoglycan-associated protein
LAALCALPAAADVTVRGETGLAGAISTPARDYFGLGFHLGAAAGYDVLRFLEVGGRIGYDFLSRNDGSPLPGPGSVVSLGPAARLHLPWASAYVPWLDASLLYARTGELDRVAFSLNVGFQFPLPGRSFFIGPWLGLTQVFHLSDGSSYPTQDATIVTGGVALDWSALRPPDETAASAHPKDRDGDGIPDRDDDCPSEPGIAALRGCPDPDPDHDGIIGAADRCPNVAEDRDGFEDEDGCPDFDDDHDGVADVDDACPRVPGPLATHGCPDQDADGVADADDRCPSVPGVASEHGCPAYTDLTIGDATLTLDQKISFAPNAATVQPASYALLDQLAQAFADRATLCLRIDAQGPAPKLPQARADSVRTYLILHGVSPSRVTARGLGVTKEADARVELVIVPCEVSAP